MAESKQEHFAFNFGKDLTLKETPQQDTAADVPAAASAEAASVEGGAAPTPGVVASTPAGAEQAQQQPEEEEEEWIELAAAQEEHGSTVSASHLPCIIGLKRLALLWPRASAHSLHSRQSIGSGRCAGLCSDVINTCVPV